MRQIGDFIGGLIALFFFGVICYAAITSGSPEPIIIIAVLILIFGIAAWNENIKTNAAADRLMQLGKIDEEKKTQRIRIEAMTDSEFVSFVKINIDKLDRFLTNEGIFIKHGIESKKWSTNKYYVISEIETNNFSELLTIVRKSNKEEIYSGIRNHSID